MTIPVSESVSKWHFSSPTLPDTLFIKCCWNGFERWNTANGDRRWWKGFRLWTGWPILLDMISFQIFGFLEPSGYFQPSSHISTRQRSPYLVLSSFMYIFLGQENILGVDVRSWPEVDILCSAILFLLSLTSVLHCKLAVNKIFLKGFLIWSSWIPGFGEPLKSNAKIYFVNTRLFSLSLFNLALKGTCGLWKKSPCFRQLGLLWSQASFWASQLHQLSLPSGFVKVLES